MASLGGQYLGWLFFYMSLVFCWSHYTVYLGLSFWLFFCFLWYFFIQFGFDCFCFLFLYDLWRSSFEEIYTHSMRSLCILLPFLLSLCSNHLFFDLFLQKPTHLNRQIYQAINALKFRLIIIRTHLAHYWIIDRGFNRDFYRALSWSCRPRFCGWPEVVKVNFH